MKMKKQLIYFEQKTYDSSVKKWKVKQEAKDELLKAVKDLIGKEVKDDFIEDPINNFNKLIEQKYKSKNQLGLSATKLIDVLEIDISEFIKAKAKYDTFKETQKPNIDDYSHFTETDQENKKLDAVNDVINSLSKLSNYTHVYPSNIANGVSRSIRADMETMKLYPNVGWVKSWKGF